MNVEPVGEPRQPGTLPGMLWGQAADEPDVVTLRHRGPAVDRVVTGKRQPVNVTRARSLERVDVRPLGHEDPVEPQRPLEVGRQVRMCVDDVRRGPAVEARDVPRLVSCR